MGFRTNSRKSGLVLITTEYNAEDQLPRKKGLVGRKPVLKYNYNQSMGKWMSAIRLHTISLATGKLPSTGKYFSQPHRYLNVQCIRIILPKH